MVVRCWLLDVGCSQNQEFGGVGIRDGFGASSLFSTTAMPLRSLKRPAVTTLSPAFKPDYTLTKSPCARPVRMNFCCTMRFVLPFATCGSITKTESP